MAVWAVVNQKGGVGKTAVTLHLASTVARLGAKTLLVDLDPQASSTKVIDPAKATTDAGDEITIADIMLTEGDYPISEVVVGTTWGFDLAPSDIKLARREQNRDVGAESKLRASLEGHGYDVVLIDSPPSLGILTINGLAAADEALIVTTPGFAAMRGLADLLLGDEIEEMGRTTHRPSTIEAVRQNYNRDLRVAGFVVNMAENTNDAQGHLNDLKTAAEGWGIEVWKPSLPRRAAMAASYSAGVPLHDLPPSTAGVRPLMVAFEELGRHLLEVNTGRAAGGVPIAPIVPVEGVA